MSKPLRMVIWAAAITLFAFQSAVTPVLAQDAKLKKEELDQLLAPIALYPDDLLTNVLMASTYPLTWSRLHAGERSRRITSSKAMRW